MLDIDQVCQLKNGPADLVAFPWFKRMILNRIVKVLAYIVPAHVSLAYLAVDIAHKMTTCLKQFFNRGSLLDVDALKVKHQDQKRAISLTLARKGRQNPIIP